MESLFIFPNIYYPLPLLNRHPHLPLHHLQGCCMVEHCSIHWNLVHTVVADRSLRFLYLAADTTGSNLEPQYSIVQSYKSTLGSAYRSPLASSVSHNHTVGSHTPIMCQNPSPSGYKMSPT